MLAGAAPGAPPAIASTRPVAESESFAARLEQALSLAQAGEFAAADAIIRGLMADPQFPQLPDEAQAAVYMLAGTVAYALEDTDRAWALLDRVAADPRMDPAFAEGILGLAIDGSRADKAVAPVQVLAKRAPDKLQSLDDRTVYRLNADLRKQSAPATERIAYLQALFDANRLTEDGRQPSGLWLDLTQLRLDQGDLPAAIATARRISSASELLSLQVDRRFDPVVAALPSGQLDLAAALTREIDTVKSQIAREPRDLQNVVELTYLLLQAGRYQDALDACDAALAQSAAAKDAPAFDDEDDSLIWIQDNRARALLGLGRVDEAIAVWEDARRRPENGGDNVSQAINIAMLYGELGRSGEALTALSGVKQASEFGWMQYHLARYSALVDDANDPRGEESLAYLRDNRKDAQSAYFAALVMKGDMDEASRVYREWLADPAHRTDALLAVQSYANQPVSPRSAAWKARTGELVRRQDVSDAIQAVGRVKQVPLYDLGP